MPPATVDPEAIITDAKNSCWTHLYGLTRFGQLFNVRQLISLMSFAWAVRDLAGSPTAMLDDHRRQAIITMLGICVSKLSDFSSSLCTFNYTGGRSKNTFRRAQHYQWSGTIVKQTRSIALGQVGLR